MLVPGGPARDPARPAGLQDLSDITVAVIDTGFARSGTSPNYTDHEDLEGIFRDEYDFYGAALNPSSSPTVSVPKSSGRSSNPSRTRQL